MAGEKKIAYVPPDVRPKRDTMAHQPGDRVRLTDGSLREVVNNPMDGVWMIVKEIDVADAEDEMVVLTEIAGPA
jgi:hypothetical protein